MNRQFSIRFILFLIACDLILLNMALLIAGQMRILLPVGQEVSKSTAELPVFIYGMTSTIWLFVFLLTNVYQPRQLTSLITELQAIIPSVFLAGLAFAGGLYLTHSEVPRLQIVYFFSVYLVMLILFRLVLRAAFWGRGGKRFRIRRVAVIGGNPAARTIRSYIDRQPWLGLGFAGFIANETADQPHLGKLKDAQAVIEKLGVTEVIFTIDPHVDLEAKQLVYDLQHLPVNLRVVPDYFDLAFLRMQVEQLGDIALLTLKEPVLSPADRLIKRVFDVMITILLLIPSLPLMTVIAIAIALDGSGPVVFNQVRLGERQRPFTMYKFRSMTVDAKAFISQVVTTTATGEVLHKHPNDPRVTPVGRFLRRSSLDELPQLFNVLRGDMSLVGPRPELPWMVEKYQPWQRKRFEVPQGMTGWWQINGRADAPMHLSTELDLYYIQNYTLWLDLKILWRTIGVVLSGRGAY